MKNLLVISDCNSTSERIYNQILAINLEYGPTLYVVFLSILLLNTIKIFSINQSIWQINSSCIY